MRKRVLSLFLAWVMCLSLLPTALAAEGHKHEAAMFFSNEKLTYGKGFSKGDPFTGATGLVYGITISGDYYLTDDIDLAYPLLIYYNTSVTICLNGHSLTYNKTAVTPDNYADAVIICEDAAFDLMDCQAPAEPAHMHPVCGQACADGIHDPADWTGVNTLDDAMPAGYYYLTDNITLTETWHPSNGTVVCLNGKTITADGDFDAVSITESVEFTLTDCSADTTGAITHIANGSGCGVSNSGIFHLYGGCITGNAVGVEQNSRMTVSGAVQVSGNSSGNVVLADGRRISVDGTLSGTASIGVTTENIPEPGSPIIVAEGVSDSDHFVSDTGYTVSYSDGTVYFSRHEHRWNYQPAEHTLYTIREVCADCNEVGGSVTLEVPADAVYDGRPKTAVIHSSDDWNSGAVEITYTKVGTPGFDSIPTDAGTYTAHIECGTAAVQATYTIAKAVLTENSFIFIPPEDLVYDGQSKTASVTSDVTDGVVTVQYFRGNEAVQPINAGTYTVQVTAAEGTNHTAAVLRSDDWSFTIQRAPQIIYVPTGKLLLKNGIPVDISDWASAEGALTYALKGKPNGVSLDNNLLTAESSVTLSGITIIAYAAQTENYNAASQQFEVSLLDKPRRELTVSMNDWTYGDTPNEPEYTASGRISFTYADANGILLENIPTNAGKYTVTVTCETDAEILAGSAAFTIHPKSLTTDMVDAIAPASYTGQAIQPEPEVKDTAILVSGTDFVYRYGENTNVGCGTVTIIGQGNYTGEISREFTITKAVLTVDGTPTASAVYGTPIKDIPVTGLRAKLKDTVIPGTWVFSDETIPNAGNTAAYLAVFIPENGAENYEPLTRLVAPTITKAPGYITAPVGRNGLVYTGALQTLIQEGHSTTGEMQYRLDNSAYSTALPQAENAGTYRIWYKSFGDTNHEDTTESSLEVHIAKQPIAVPAADTTAYTYNGKDQHYQLVENTAYRIDNAMQTNAGEYDVTVSLLDKSNTCWAGENEDTTDKAFPFHIKPAVLTIKAKDRTISVGNTLPDWDTPVLDRDYTISGLFGADKLGGTLTLRCDPAPDLTKPGQTDIVIDGAKAGSNYIIVYQPGTLTIQARQTVSSGGGSSSAPSKHPVSVPSSTVGGSVKSGAATAAKGSTVTITVTPDANYRLDTLTITDAKGNMLLLTDKGNGQYSFIMPSSQVTITPVFVEKTTAEPAAMPFHDVSADDYFYTPVKWAAEQKITSGVSAELFAPESGCTRAQIITFLWRAAGSPVVNYAIDLMDVPADSYYTEAIRWALSEGITTGITADLFCPDDICTRAQAVTFLARAQNAKTDDTVVFTDVPSDSCYANAIAWAASTGITSGVAPDRFAPGSTCTRAQIVTFLYRSFAQGK